MKDPFGLAQPSEEAKKKLEPKKLYLIWMIIFGSLFIMASLLAVYFAKNRISADSQRNYSASIKLSGLPQEINTGDALSATLTVENISRFEIPDAYVVLRSNGVDLRQTFLLHAGQSEGEGGYIREANLNDLAKFDQNSSGEGVYWKIGALKAGETKSKQIKGVISAGSDYNCKIEAKLLLSEERVVPCGTLGLGRCQVGENESIIASNSFNLTLVDSSRIRLRKGYNFITLPYVLTDSAISDFFSSLKTDWVYYYKTSTAEYVNLSSEGNASLVKPGVGFWMYDFEGGEYVLPQTKVETNSNDSFSINLEVGWNQIGNPYTKKIKFDTDKITVRELSDDGSASGNGYTLKNAIENEILSDVYVISYKSSSTDLSSSVEYKKLTAGSTINAFTAFAIEAKNKVKITFPGRSIISAGDLLSSDEIRRIENWIMDNGLNHYGDPQGTVYAGGTPLFDEMTGQATDRLDYIITQHPDRLWNR